MIPGPILGLSGSNYDIDKFIYIGSTETGNPYAFFTRKTAGLDSLDKVRRTPGVRIGAHSVGHSVYVTARMFAYMLDFKEPKFVVGFNDPEMDVAFNNNELDARTSGNIDSVFKDLGDQVKFHATISNPKGQIRYAPAWPARPRQLHQERKGAQGDRSPAGISGAALAAPSRRPARRPNWLKFCARQWRRHSKIPAFQQDFKKLMGREPTPLTGEEVEKAVKELPRDREVIALYKQLADAGSAAAALKTGED